MSNLSKPTDVKTPGPAANHECGEDSGHGLKHSLKHGHLKHGHGDHIHQKVYGNC